jgi:hypothetical protein
MANEKSLQNLKPFQPGESGNPGGKAMGTRNKLNADFLNKMATDFQLYGKEAIQAAREKDPMGYVKAMCALQPKQIEQTRPLDDLNDAEVLALLEYLRGRITQNAGTGADETGSPSQAH